MSEMYPAKCCRCGFCCLSENCPNSQTIYNIPKHGVTCPALTFDKDVAICTLCNIQPAIFGIGVGCCIKASVIKTIFGKQIEIDFATLPPELKIMLAKKKRNSL